MSHRLTTLVLLSGGTGAGYGYWGLRGTPAAGRTACSRDWGRVRVAPCWAKPTGDPAGRRATTFPHSHQNLSRHSWRKSVSFQFDLFIWIGMNFRCIWTMVSFLFYFLTSAPSSWALGVLTSSISPSVLRVSVQPLHLSLLSQSRTLIFRLVCVLFGWEVVFLVAFFILRLPIASLEIQRCNVVCLASA